MGAWQVSNPSAARVHGHSECLRVGALHHYAAICALGFPASCLVIGWVVNQWLNDMGKHFPEIVYSCVATVTWGKYVPVVICYK